MRRNQSRMYHIAICDDDQIFIQYIKKIILSSGLEEGAVKFYEFYSGEELINSLHVNIEYDLLVLDIQMGKMDGNETAKLYRKKYSNTILVFCSGKVLPTVKSFEVTPFRYLLKHYSDSRMLREMEAVIEKLKCTKIEPFIIGNYNYNFIRLNLNEILYIAVSKHGSKIFINPNHIHYEFEKYVKCKEKVKELYPTLKNYGFIYAHNSYLVNLQYIKRKTMTELELVDGTILSIARSKEKELRKALAEYLSLKYD